jgi:hypothetical protein
MIWRYEQFQEGFLITQVGLQSSDIMLTRILRQRFQKEAILRQMQEYKREKSSLESRLSQMSKAATFHNDHLRVIDSWFKQVRAHSLFFYRNI